MDDIMHNYEHNTIPPGTGTVDDMIRKNDDLISNSELINDILKYSEMMYFIYYPAEHRREALVLPERLLELPKVMEDYPESLIRCCELCEDDAKACRDMFRQIDSGVHEAECVVRVKYLGKYMWYRVHLLNFFDAAGHPAYAIGNAINADKLKEAEKALNDERLRMKSLEHGILAAACFDVTEDRLIEAYTDSLLKSSYRPESEDIRSDTIASCGEIYDQSEKTREILLDAACDIPDRQQRLKFVHACSHVGMLENYDAGKREEILEYRRNTANGLIWVSTRVALLSDPETENVLAFFYTSDINDRMIMRQITESLMNRNYLKTSYIDMKTGKTYSLSGLPGSAPEDERESLMPHFRLEHILDELEKMPVYTKSFRERCSENEDRQYRHMQITAFFLNEEKRYLVISRSDITDQFEQEQHQKEVLRLAAKKAEKANAAKTDFLSKMSHDIRTPLNGIIGMTALAKDEQDPGKIRDYLEKIDESGHFLLGLVNDILDMSKVESGKVELHPENYPVSDFRRYLMSVIQPLCDSKGLNFIVSMDLPGEYALYVDKLRFAQIFFNLLSNSVKFTASGGYVIFRICDPVISGDFMEADYIVSDSGSGMSSEFQKHMFEPFEQEKTDSNALRTGSGLGLAIVKSMVGLMHGTITVESSPGVGSIFTVHLRIPVIRQEAVSRVKKAVYDQLSGKHILVAEDNAINAEIEIRLLEKKGVSVSHASDGEEAVKLFGASEYFDFDAVLMDIRMPVMDGFQATRLIRLMNRPDAEKIPIIALTANAFDEDVKKCLDAGMTSHIAKPIEINEFYEKLEKELDDN